VETRLPAVVAQLAPALTRLLKDIKAKRQNAQRASAHEPETKRDFVTAKPTRLSELKREDRKGSISKSRWYEPTMVDSFTSVYARIQKYWQNIQTSTSNISRPLPAPKSPSKQTDEHITRARAQQSPSVADRRRKMGR
jgi:hypothetical protein